MRKIMNFLLFMLCLFSFNIVMNGATKVNSVVQEIFMKMIRKWEKQTKNLKNINLVSWEIDYKIIFLKLKIEFTKRVIYDKIELNKSIGSEQNVRNIDF